MKVWILRDSDCKIVGVYSSRKIALKRMIINHPTLKLVERDNLNHDSLWSKADEEDKLTKYVNSKFTTEGR